VRFGGNKKSCFFVISVIFGEQEIQGPCISKIHDVYEFKAQPILEVIEFRHGFPQFCLVNHLASDTVLLALGQRVLLVL